MSHRFWGLRRGCLRGAVHQPTSVLPHICLHLSQDPPTPRPHTWLPDWPCAVLAPREGGPSLACPGAGQEADLLRRNMRRRQVAGQGDIYGHSAGAPVACLTPSGLPTRAGFIALCSWEQWPLKVPCCLSSAASRGRETIHRGRPRCWCQPHSSACFLLGSLSHPPSHPPALCQAWDPRPPPPSWEGHPVGQQPFPFVFRPASEFCLSHSRYVSCLLWGKQKQKIFCH